MLYVYIFAYILWQLLLMMFGKKYLQMFFNAQEVSTPIEERMFRTVFPTSPLFSQHTTQSQPYR